LPAVSTIFREYECSICFHKFFVLYHRFSERGQVSTQRTLRFATNWAFSNVVSRGPRSVHLRRVLKDYFEYYNRYRVHQSLEMDAPAGREIHYPEEGNIVAVPHLGGLDHHYERRAA
jgi:hypothetical protein